MTDTPPDHTAIAEIRRRAQARGRQLTRGAIVSVLGNLALAAISLVAAINSSPDPAETAFWYAVIAALLAALTAVVLVTAAGAAAVGEGGPLGGVVGGFLFLGMILAALATLPTHQAAFAIVPVMGIVLNLMLLLAVRTLRLANLRPSTR